MQIRVDYGGISGDLLAEGMSACPACGKYAFSRAVLVDGFTYLLQFCECGSDTPPRLIGKGAWYRDRWRKIPGNWPWTKIEKGDIRPWFDKHNPRPVLSLMLTNQCSSRCRICRLISVGINVKTPFEIDPEIAKNKIAAHKGRIVAFCCVEPTGSRHLPDLIAFSSSRGFFTLISTNGMELAREDYLDQLLRCGLNFAFISFDGFNEASYEIMRGGRHQLALKLRALDNLKRRKVKIGIKCVLVRNVNDDQVGAIINYAADAENTFITEVSFQSLSLGGNEEMSGFTKNNLISEEEIKLEIQRALFLEGDYFREWDIVKVKLAAFVSIFGFIKLLPMDLDNIYFFRKNGKLIPVIPFGRLRKINSYFKSYNPLAVPLLLFSLVETLLKYRIKLRLPDLSLLETAEGVLRIRIRFIAKPSFYPFPGTVVKANIFPGNYSPGKTHLE